MGFTEKLGEGLTSDRFRVLADGIGTDLARADNDNISSLDWFTRNDHGVVSRD